MVGVLRIAKSVMNPDCIRCYQNVHCTACKAMKKCCGMSYCIFLPYETTFLLLCHLAFAKKKINCIEKIEKKITICSAMPIRPVTIYSVSKQLQNALAAFSIIGAFSAIDDHVRDDRKLLSALALPWISRKLDYALKTLNIERESAADPKEFQKIVEPTQITISDMLELYSKQVADIWMHGFWAVEMSLNNRILASLSQHLSRLMLVLDSLRDMKTDRKNGKPNPINSIESRMEAEKIIQHSIRTVSLIVLSGSRPWSDIMLNIIQYGIMFRIPPPNVIH